MSLARAFTTRRAKEDLYQPQLGRAATTRNGRPVKRSQISAPVALLSSTNSLSYDAPDLPGTRRIHTRNMTGSSLISMSDESDVPSLSFDGTDASSIDESPTSAEPMPNHLSCYFKPAVDTKTPTLPHRSSTTSSCDAPSVPQRVPSHSKRAHEKVHRKRSVQRMISPPTSLHRNSNDFFGHFSQPLEAPLDNPFGNELAQLDAVAEEMSHAVRDAETENDRHIMQEQDLGCYVADDYLSEINQLIFHYLADDHI